MEIENRLHIASFNCGGGEAIAEARGYDVLCAQETKLSFWRFQLKGKKPWLEGVFQYGRKDQLYSCFAWNNDKQTGYKDLAVISNYKVIQYLLLEIKNTSPSKGRGLPGVTIEFEGVKFDIYSYHSQSSGENTQHLDDILSTLEEIHKSTKNYWIVVGDYNFEARVAETTKMNQGICSVIAGNTGSRPLSKTPDRVLDYCVTNIDNKKFKLEWVGAKALGKSDHLMQMFSLSKL